MSRSSVVRSGTRPGLSPLQVHDPAFAAALGDSPRLIRVVETDAHEGPVYAADEDALYFTTLPRRTKSERPPKVAIKRVALDGMHFPLEADRISAVREDANVANGMAMHLDGRLVVCEQGTPTQAARIALLDRRTGRTESLVVGSRGLPLNSPNDVVVAGNGNVWFTDPSYGYLQGFRPEPKLGDHVYRFDPRTKELAAVAVGFDKPNGLALSPNESVLYVGDSGANHEPGTYDPRRPHHVTAFDVQDGRRLDHARLFAVTVPGFPDGIKVDAEGRVYVSAASGVQVFAPDGRALGEIGLPGAVNFCFGGRDGNVLFITTDDAIWGVVFAARVAPTEGA